MLLAQTILYHKLILRQQFTVQKREFSGIYRLTNFLMTNPV